MFSLDFNYYLTIWIWSLDYHVYDCDFEYDFDFDYDYDFDFDFDYDYYILWSMSFFFTDEASPFLLWTPAAFIVVFTNCSATSFKWSTSLTLTWRMPAISNNYSYTTLGMLHELISLDSLSVISILMACSSFGHFAHFKGNSQTKKIK